MGTHPLRFLELLSIKIWSACIGVYVLAHTRIHSNVDRGATGSTRPWSMARIRDLLVSAT